MEWIHKCGWRGTNEELIQDIYDGILYGRSCPQCSEEWPFFYDEDNLPEEDGNEE